MSLAATISPLYRTAINMVTTLQTRFAASLLSCLTSTRTTALDGQSNPPEQFRFSTRIQNRRDKEDDDNAAVNAQEDIPEDALFLYHMNNGSSRVWSTPECRLMQIDDVKIIIFDPECEGKLVVVDYTRGKESNYPHDCNVRWWYRCCHCCTPRAYR